MAAEEGVDIVDAAMAPLSGMTSQPNLNTLVEALRFTERDTGLDFETLQPTADYWEAVRELYRPVRDAASWRPSADVYLHEMPGGQYTNLYQQAQARSAWSDRWPEVCRMYAEVNQMFGDIVKVTPTSKVVGDMALFMVANNLTPGRRARTATRELAFPESVVEFFEGQLGQPPGGFPKKLQKRVLRGRKPMTGPARRQPCRRPISPPREPSWKDRSADGQRPRRGDATCCIRACSPTSPPTSASIRTPACCRRRSSSTAWSRARKSASTSSAGKTLIIKFLTVGDPHADGRRTGVLRAERPAARGHRAGQVAGRTGGRPAEGASPAIRCTSARRCPAWWCACWRRPGEEVTAGQKLFTLEAMKMETTIYADRAGRVAEVLVKAGTQVEAGDLLLRYEG